MISIIIPVINEEQALTLREDSLQKLAKTFEVIFVDGGSHDDTTKIASRIGKVLHTHKGRAHQMNLGASSAKGDILLFLHADTMLTEECFDDIENTINQKGCVGGCFYQVFDQPGLMYRWIAFTGNIRARLSKIFYGDQGIFVRKEIFDQIGGYPETELCEDVLFTKMMKKAGKVDVLSRPIHCSARRWTEQGLLKTFLLNMRINFALTFGCNLNHLSKTYDDIREGIKQ